VGVTALGLFFWGHRLAGLSEWIDIFLVIVGIALILIELFIIPGFGITGALGIISLLSGIILTLISHPIYPPFESFNRAAGLIISSFLFGSILLFISFKFLPKSKAWEKIVLRSTISREKIVQENLEAREGIALSDLRPSGRGRFNGKIYDVETMGDYIKKGEKIQIISKHGSIIKVRKV
jgi:membrane-bound serine protease (ClpP class)